jgi:mono/diheme cytochrome c family protein
MSAKLVFDLHAIETGADMSGSCKPWQAIMALAVAALGLVACGPRAEAPAPEEQVAAAPAAPPAAGPAARTSVADASQDTPVYRGSTIARQVCTQCHDVGAGSAPAVNIGAPAFAAIAGSGEVTGASLLDKMRGAHPPMPQYLLEEAALADVAAYIESLQPPS